MTRRSLHENPIAIIGQAAVFAKASNLNEYWNNIVDEIDGITDVPPSRWDIDEYYDPDPDAEDKTYCKKGGFIPDIDFNPLEFGLPPNLLEVTDSSQLLGLVVARDALENAGYGEGKTFDRQRTGVVLGVAGGQKLITDLSARLQYPIWRKVLESSGISQEDTQKIIDKIKLAYAPWNENAFPGLLGNVIAGRIANRLDLGGMNTVVDAACASSLAAVKSAVSELVEGRADMMITGGVDTDNSPFTFMCFSATPAFSPTGDIRPFDDEANGMLIGEGLGMMVLKRLQDAERDGDTIYAVIRGIGSSSDGKFKSIYAPRPSGQSLALQRAYDDAGVPPHSVGLIEAHGTGTNAGDPAEFEGLTSVFGQPNGQSQHIALGSVKSQVGHTKAAAGAAGMIKAALALHHKVLPPTINVEKPASKLNIEKSHFYVNTETRPWFLNNGAEKRRAGVSAFGFGGTNFHIVLEEYQSNGTVGPSLTQTSQEMLLTAQDPASLRDQAAQILQELQAADGGQSYLDVVRRSRTLTIPQGQPRMGYVASSREEAIQLLKAGLDLLESKPEADSWDHPRGIHFRRQGLPADHGVVALYPGQGSQYLNMGRDATLHFPPLRSGFEAMDQRFMDDGLAPLSDVVYPIPAFDDTTREVQERHLRKTDYAQASIGVLSFGLTKILQQVGFEPDFSAGHSFGELTALWAGGVLEDSTFLDLVKARGQAMVPPDKPGFDAGTMAAIKGPLQDIQREVEPFPEITIANQNSDTQTVLAGPQEAIDRIDDHLSNIGYKVTQLPVSAAFHTSLVEHASQPFAAAVAEQTFHEPHLAVFSNTTGEQYPSDEQESKNILGNHILNPVIFKDQIDNLYQAGGRIFVEIGPRNVISNLVDEILDGKPHETVTVNPSPERSSERQLRAAAVKMRVIGLPLGDIGPHTAKLS